MEAHNILALLKLQWSREYGCSMAMVRDAYLARLDNLEMFLNTFIIINKSYILFIRLIESSGG